MIIKFKPITAVNNSPDINGYGHVSSAYRISECPISNEVYCTYLNEQYHSNSNILYNKQDIEFNKIFKSKNKIIAQKPITSISYNDVRNFILWLNKQDKGNIYSLPTADQWYKAAYYNPEEKIYYNFPNRQNTIPQPVKDPTSIYGLNTNKIYGTVLKNKFFAMNYSFFDVRDCADNVYEFLRPNNSKCYIAGSSWNRDIKNAHKDRFCQRYIHHQFYCNYIGFRICKNITPISFSISLHNEFGDGWKGDYINIYDTNYGIIASNITLNAGYESNKINLSLYNLTDNYIIVEYKCNTKFYYENFIKIYNNKELVCQLSIDNPVFKKVINIKS